MTPDRRRCVLDYIVERRNALPVDNRPDAVWIRQHAPLDHDAASATTPVLAVWLLNASGIRGRVVRLFSQFWDIKVAQTWDRAVWPTGGLPPKDDPRWPAQVAFASFADSDDVYLEFVWGRMGTYPVGLRLTLDDDGNVFGEQTLWIG